MNRLYYSLIRKRFMQVLALILLWPALLFAQDEKELAAVTRTYAITNVNIVQAPGRKIDMGTVVIKDGLIISVGKGINIPPEAIVIKADSMYVYAGFIDGLTRAGVNKPKEENKERVKEPGNPPPDRAGINPQVDVRSFLNPADKGLEELRNLGFTTAQVVPYGNLLPGQSAIVLTSGSSADNMVLVPKSSLYSELTGAQGMYPSTIMAIMAKWRELYRQASQAKSYESLYASNRAGLERPVSDKILEAFYPVIDQKMSVLFKSEKLLETNRVFTLKSELGFVVTIADVKEGWPIINKVKASGAKVFLSLDLPEEKKKEDAKGKDDKKDGTRPAAQAAKPEVKKDDKPKTEFDIEKEGLEKRKTEAIANYTSQAANFSKAGVDFGFSSMTAKSKDIHANLRRMIAAGLTEDAALAALTTAPAQLLGLSDRMGTIDNGKMANLVISDKSYFHEKAKVKYVFVDGVLHKIEVKEVNLPAGQAGKEEGNVKTSINGTWSYSTESPEGTVTGKITIKEEGGAYSGKITNSLSGKDADIKNVALSGNELSFSFAFESPEGLLTIDVKLTIDGAKFNGTMAEASVGTFPVTGTKDPKF